MGSSSTIAKAMSSSSTATQKKPQRETLSSRMPGAVNVVKAHWRRLASSGNSLARLQLN